MGRRGTLNDRERLFVREYLVDLNATQAAIRAGYSPNGASVRASILLKRPVVAKAVEAAMAARERALEITAERVLEEFALMGFSNLMDYFTPQPDGTALVDLSRLTRDQAAALTEIQVEEFTSGRGAAGREVRKVKIKLADKLRSLELVAKHLGISARKSGENNDEEEGTGDVELSDEDRAQEILRLLVAGRKSRD